MESTFERIDSCMLGYFSSAIDPTTYTQADCAVFQYELQECYLAFRKSIISFVFSADDHRKVEYRIRQLQRQLVCLADYVDLFLSAKKSRKRESLPYRKACRLGTGQLEQMLTFIEQHFPHFLDMNEKVPAGYKRLLQREMVQRLTMVKTMLVAFELTPEYVQLIMQPAEELLQANAGKSYTYHDIWYLKRMYEELILTCKSLGIESSFNKITEFLVSINFNSPLFHRFYTKHFALTVADAGNLTEQIEKLSWWQKEIAHLFKSVSTPFIPQMPGSKESLETWVLDEMKHLEKVHQIASILQAQPEAVKQPRTFSTSLSVAEFACLFRILVDNKIFHHESQLEMINFFASHFKTEMTDRISANSLKKSYYDISPKTAKIVRGILIELINTTRSFE